MQIISPTEHVHPNRLMVTIVTVAVASFLLVLLFLYQQASGGGQPPVLVTPPIHARIDAKRKAMSDAVTLMQGAQPASSAEIEAGLKQLSASGAQPASQSQKDEAVSQLKN